MSYTYPGIPRPGFGLLIVFAAIVCASASFFLLGPDVLAQIMQKRRIMLHHLRDIEDYMATPFK